VGYSYYCYRDHEVKASLPLHAKTPGVNRKPKACMERMLGTVFLVRGRERRGLVATAASFSSGCTAARERPQ
jgi:hypothetical protein